MNQAVNVAKMQPEIREMLLNHRIGIASAYYRPSEAEILGEYMRAIEKGAFVLSEEAKLLKRCEKLEVEKTQFDRLAAQIKALEAKIK